MGTPAASAGVFIAEWVGFEQKNPSRHNFDLPPIRASGDKRIVMIPTGC
jgi:hypothetical protein